MKGIVVACAIIAMCPIAGARADTTRAVTPARGQWIGQYGCVNGPLGNCSWAVIGDGSGPLRSELEVRAPDNGALFGTGSAITSVSQPTFDVLTTPATSVTYDVVFHLDSIELTHSGMMHAQLGAVQRSGGSVVVEVDALADGCSCFTSAQTTVAQNLATASSSIASTDVHVAVTLTNPDGPVPAGQIVVSPYITTQVSLDGALPDSGIARAAATWEVTSISAIEAH